MQFLAPAALFLLATKAFAQEPAGNDTLPVVTVTVTTCKTRETHVGSQTAPVQVSQTAPAQAENSQAPAQANGAANVAVYALPMLAPVLVAFL